MQIVWFKRDLRLFDNEAFKKACDKGPILPLYIFEEDLLIRALKEEGNYSKIH